MNVGEIRLCRVDPAAAGEPLDLDPEGAEGEEIHDPEHTQEEPGCPAVVGAAPMRAAEEVTPNRKA